MRLAKLILFSAAHHIPLLATVFSILLHLNMQEKDPHNILIYTVTTDINSELSATCTIVSFPDRHQNPDTEGLGTRLTYTCSVNRTFTNN